MKTFDPPCVTILSQTSFYPLIHFLLDLLDILLEKNYFVFNNEFFLQTRGVAMGSSFSSSIANLFMARLEDNFILNPNANPFFDNFFCITDI